MRFKATLINAKRLLGILQVCHSIQRNCLVRLQDERVRFLSCTTATDGMQMWMTCRPQSIFGDMVCGSSYADNSITVEVLDLAQLIHVVKQAEAREKSQPGGGAQVTIRLARNGLHPLWRIAMPGLARQPDVSFDVPLRILSDEEIKGMMAPPIHENLHLLVPDMLELATFIDKVKNTAADVVTFKAELQHSAAHGEMDDEEDEDGDGERQRLQLRQHARKRQRGVDDGGADGEGGGDGDGVAADRVMWPTANLTILAHHVMARFVLQYRGVKVLPPPREKSDTNVAPFNPADLRDAEVSIEARKFARFFSTVKELEAATFSVFLANQRAFVLSVLDARNFSLAAYIPAKSL